MGSGSKPGERASRSGVICQPPGAADECSHAAHSKKGLGGQRLYRFVEVRNVTPAVRVIVLNELKLAYWTINGLQPLRDGGGGSKLPIS